MNDLASLMLAISILFFGLAEGETWVVSQSESIQETIELASPGDTILVEGGRDPFRENVEVNKPLTLRGVGLPVVDGGGNGSSITLSADGVVVEGFAATNYSRTRSPEEAAGVKVYSNNNKIINITIYNDGAGTGIVLNGSMNNSVEANNVNHNGFGILILRGQGNYIQGNNATKNGLGIILQDSGNNTIEGNNVSFNADYGISLERSQYNTLRKNVMYENGRSFEAAGLNYIDTSNRIDGGAIYYLVLAANMTIDSTSEDAAVVYCLSCSNITIKEQVFDETGYGIRLYNTANSTIADNVLKNKNSIELHESEKNTVRANRIIGHSDADGIHLNRSRNNSIEGNNISEGSGGISLVRSEGNTIDDNVIVDNQKVGILLQDSSYNTIAGNGVSNDGSDATGIFLDRSMDNEVRDNSGSGLRDGIGLIGAYRNAIIDNVIEKSDYGIKLEDSGNNTIKRNVVSPDNRKGGVYLKGSHYNTVNENNASFDDIGVYLLSSLGNNVSKNNASYNNVFGIFIVKSNENIIKDNNASYNDQSGIEIRESEDNRIEANNGSYNLNGILFESSDGNTISGNIGSHNVEYGIRLSASDRNHITGNDASYNDLAGIKLEDSHENGIADNVLHGNEVNGLALMNCRSSSVAGNVANDSSACGITLINSMKNNLTDNGVSNNSDGIALCDSSSNLIKNNTASYNRIGVYLYQSNLNELKDNYINKNEVGVSFNSSENNTVDDNFTRDNTYDVLIDNDTYFGNCIREESGYPKGETSVEIRSTDTTPVDRTVYTGGVPGDVRTTIGKGVPYQPPSERTTEATAPAQPSSEDYQKMAEKALGMVGWDPPREMIVRHKYKINVTLGEDRERLAGYLEEEYAIYEEVNLSPKCEYEVSLTGDNFVISLKEGKAQQMYCPDIGELPMWVWEVVPTKEGDQTLKLVVYYKDISNIGVAGWAPKKRLDEWPVTVTVEEMTASDYLNDGKNFIKKYWQWLATVLIIPIVKWWMGKRRSLKKEKPGPTQEMAGTSKGPSDERPPGPSGGET